METHYPGYLALLEELRGSLDQLTGLAKEKIAAVLKDDLLALDEVLKQEQALSLSLRGLEQRRLKLVRNWDWTTSPSPACATTARMSSRGRPSRLRNACGPAMTFTRAPPEWPRAPWNGGCTSWKKSSWAWVGPPRRPLRQVPCARRRRTPEWSPRPI